MSEIFVVNASRVNIDFAYAQSLMDEYLAQQSAHWVARNADTLLKSGAPSQEQALFDYYCRRHLERFGEPFTPDIMAKPV